MLPFMGNAVKQLWFLVADSSQTKGLIYPIETGIPYDEQSPHSSNRPANP